MEVTRLDDGLWRWTTAHPEWKPRRRLGAGRRLRLLGGRRSRGARRPARATDEAERTRFLDALDRDVARLGARRGRPRHVRAGTAEAPTSSASGTAPGSSRPATGRCPAASPPSTRRPRRRSSTGSRAPRRSSQGTSCSGPTEACASARVLARGGRLSDLAAELRPLLELPVERVLTSHGPPVTSGGAAALAAALERYAPA